MFEQKPKTQNIMEQLSDAEKISIHINNLILTFGEKTVKETLTLFTLTDKIETKREKRS